MCFGGHPKLIVLINPLNYNLGRAYKYSGVRIHCSKNMEILLTQATGRLIIQIIGPGGRAASAWAGMMVHHAAVSCPVRF